MTEQERITKLEMKLSKLEEKLEKLQQSTRNMHHELVYIIAELRSSIGEN